LIFDYNELWKLVFRQIFLGFFKMFRTMKIHVELGFVKSLFLDETFLGFLIVFRRIFLVLILTVLLIYKFY